MRKNKMRKPASVLAALLFVLTGCPHYDLPPRTLVTGVNVFEDGDTVEGYVFFNSTVQERNLTAIATTAPRTVTEKDGLAFAWSVTEGDDIVGLFWNGSQATVRPKPGVTQGIAKIRAEAFFEHSSNSAELYVFVNPGTRDWSFVVFNEQTELSKPGDTNKRLVIAQGGTKTITLKAFGSGLTFSIVSNTNSSVITPSVAVGIAIDGDSFNVSASNSLKSGNSILTVKAEKGGDSLQAAFTAAIGIEPEEGVLVSWNRETYPITVPITAGGNNPVFSGYGDVDFRTLNVNATPTAGGALTITGIGVLVIGGGPTSGSAETNAASHVPGLFDLSHGTFRLTLDYTDASATGDNPWFRVSINNNALGMANSVLGNDSVFHYDTTQLPGAGAITLTFTPEDRFASVAPDATNSLKTAFIALMYRNTSITITGIRLEKVQ